MRLIARRLPPEVAQARRERVRVRTDSLRRRGQQPSAETLALCEWCVLATATNASADLLSGDQVLLLYRSRWQIELLFKLWKQHGRLDEWRTHNLNRIRIQTELYAKLLVLLVQHWLLVATCWQFVDKSLVKAARCLRRHVPHLLAALSAPPTLRRLLTWLAHGMALCHVARRRKRPAFHQALDRLMPCLPP